MDGECEVDLPHTPISPGCFDVGCAIADPANVAQIDGVASAAACQELCAQEPECMYFLFRTDGGTGLAQSEEQRSTSSGPNCRLKPASSQARIITGADDWPGVCGPKTCKDVVEERFHWGKCSRSLCVFSRSSKKRLHRRLLRAAGLADPGQRRDGLRGVGRRRALARVRSPAE